MIRCLLVFLFLCTQIKKVAIIGPHANATQVMLSSYHGTNTLVNSHSPLQALTARLGAGKIEYAIGCKSVGDNDTSDIAAAVVAAKASDLAVVFIGLDETQEKESLDRTTLVLPGAQDQLTQAVFNANKNTIVVLINGGPLAIRWIKDNVPAIVEAFYPGELGGEAIADILVGDVNPSGRLPYTVYPQDYIQRSYFDMNLRDNGGCTYRFYTGTPLWTFGDGLSYTTFNYSWSEGDGSITADANQVATDKQTILYEVKVTNTGDKAGADTVLGFLTDQPQSDAPKKELFDFGRVFLKPGESAVVHLAIGPQELSSVDVHGTQFVKTGRYGVAIGNLRAELLVTGTDYEMFSLQKMREMGENRQ